MYDLHLTPEQLEIRDTVRDFVTQEIKPVVLKAERLDVGDRRLAVDLLDAASQMGLRTFALSEENGGAGADALTACIVAEELAAGDADIAAILAETSRLGHLLFDRALNDQQRATFLPKFTADDRAHIAFAAREPGSDTRLGIHYHRPATSQSAIRTTAVKASNGDWIVNGEKDCVANAPLAALFAVLVQISGRTEPSILLASADAPGLSVRAHDNAWPHGVFGKVLFKDCRVPVENLLGGESVSLLTDVKKSGRGIPLLEAINLGVGRAAYEVAVDYARLRVQGGRPLIEHQAIATKLADIAIRLDVARASVWRAAWAYDHPQAYADRSLPDLPLEIVAHVFTSEAIMRATKDAAEIFGAMGVMRDMPLAKYIHDARVCLHSGDGNSDARLRIAEEIAGYQRNAAGALAMAGE
jgi:alkylation response protein AidB-like acyl-CoA dehydrogenase